MKYIELTKGMQAMVDDADYEHLSQWKWFAHRRSNKKHYAAARNIKVDGKRKTWFMHNEIMGHTGVDHVNGDPLDNRKSNLRLASQQQNNCNRARKSAGTSKYKGVYRHHKKWAAAVHAWGTRYYLGAYEEEADAAQVYNFAVAQHHGEFAYYNLAEGANEGFI